MQIKYVIWCPVIQSTLKYAVFECFEMKIQAINHIMSEIASEHCVIEWHFKEKTGKNGR